MIKKENKYLIFDNPININLKYFIKKSLAFVLSFFYKIRMNLLHVKTSEKKYKVAICAIFKNEAQYLKEWIEFHKIVGIDHFYLYNNNSEDDYNSVLTPYIEEGIVTLIQWPKNQAQMECYEDCVKRFSSEVQWFGFIDIDEFICPNDYEDVYSFLRKFEKNRSNVIVYWRMFCSSGLINRDRNALVTESFTVCWPKITDIGKCFYNTNFDFDLNYKKNKCLHHYMWGKHNGKMFPPVNSDDKVCIYGFHTVKNEIPSIQINHYFTKSYQEYLEKKSKGDVYFKINPHDEDYFYRHEMLCQSSDYHIYKYLIKLKLVMGIK